MNSSGGVLSMDAIILAGYIFTGSLLNIVALFISTFYQHSIKKNSPQTGFVVAVVFSFIYIGLVFADASQGALVNIMRFVSLVGYSVSSAYSIIMLYLIMGRDRK